MKNRLVLFGIVFLTVSFGNSFADENTIIELTAIGEPVIYLDSSNRLFRADVKVENFDPSDGAYYMKVVQLSTGEILSQQEIFVKNLPNQIWGTQIAYLALVEEVGDYEIQMYTEFGSATSKISFSIVEKEAVPSQLIEQSTEVTFDQEPINYELIAIMNKKIFQTGDNAILSVFLEPSNPNEEIHVIITKSNSEIISHTMITDNAGFAEFQFTITDSLEGRYLAKVSAEIDGQELNDVESFSVTKVVEPIQEVTSQSVFEPPQQTQTTESIQEEELSKTELIRKYCYTTNDRKLLDSRTNQFCPYGTYADLEAELQIGQITLILMAVGIIAAIVVGIIFVLKKREKKQEIVIKSASETHAPVKTPRIDSTPYGITYHTSGRNEVKIHYNSCRFYRNASQSGSTKWVFLNGFQNAKSNAASIANQQSTYYKNAQCCLNGRINSILSTALFISLIPFLGLVGNLIVRDYYPTLGKGLKYFGLVYGAIAIIYYVVNYIIIS